MADLVTTPANCAASASAKKRTITGGATIVASDVLYEDSADSFKGKLAQADAAATAEVAGVALNGGGDGQPIEICYEDEDFTPGGTLTVGQVYVLSAATAGKWAPYADLLATNRVSLLLVAKTAAVGHLKLINSGVAKP